MPQHMNAIAGGQLKKHEALPTQSSGGDQPLIVMAIGPEHIKVTGEWVVVVVRVI